MNNNMRAKLESLPLSEIREIAKENGITKISATRKSQLVEKLLDSSFVRISVEI